MYTDALRHGESVLLLLFASQTSIMKEGYWIAVCGIHRLRAVDNMFSDDTVEGNVARDTHFWYILALQG